MEFVKALRAQIKRKLLIVWDGAAQHKSGQKRKTIITACWKQAELW